MDKLQKIASLCKRKGFVFPNSEIYGGIQGFYDYGPLGVLMKNNIKNLWIREMIQNHENVMPIDGAIITHPMVWEASGHVENFGDPLVDCRQCKKRFAADKLIDEWAAKQPNHKHPFLKDGATYPSNENKNSFSAGNLPQEEMNEIIKYKIKCPECGGDLTEIRRFNLLVETSLGVVEGEKRTAYLRGEACQNIYLNYKNVLDSMRMKIPFGICQIGKAFRNEITPGQFLFRQREFEQWDLQWFTSPREMDKWYEYWKEERMKWYKGLVNNPEDLRFYRHGEKELAHYAKKAFDVQYKTEFGWKEWEGIHWRGDWDLSRHGEYSKNDFTYTDAGTGEKFIPWIVETSGGVDRTFLFLLMDAYEEEDVEEIKKLRNKEIKEQRDAIEGGKKDIRIVLKLKSAIAPYKVAVFPLMRNKEEIVKKAKFIYDSLKLKFMIAWDDNGNVGKRYRRQDEIGTPWCVTVDYETLENDTVTVRDRDSMSQVRVAVEDLERYFAEKLSRC
ncbi:glycine--tRNA ligase [Candidatus Falkowbacteria bacterium RBG_13_39_14]|uniref:Glycine--tRNA ligase n=1 Tax=Candidatus Falkowbacteria bacterium RBG_13_39_14 TaxID=1797985 RepID=A0A1F5S5V8_9BACT|nr:MAG: glycine--tRNA ligase [Candidatus Falkowbacteria bacterium RBG_13_39_14]